MISVPPALSFLLVIVAGWVHRQQLIVIDRKTKAGGARLDRHSSGRHPMSTACSAMAH
jgi:hypothetical protein